MQRNPPWVVSWTDTAERKLGLVENQTRNGQGQAVDFLQPTQMQSSSTKAATSHLKHTEATFVKEACRFKAGEDPDDSCARLETHFKKHGMDTITCRNDPNEPKKMVSVFNSHPPFTIESMKVRNFDVIGEHDTCDEQNNDDAIECFMNSLREDLRQQS